MRTRWVCFLLLLCCCAVVPSSHAITVFGGGGLPAPGGEGTCLLITGGQPGYDTCLVEGSTGITSATANGAMYATGTGSGTSTAALTNGQILIGRSATTPVAGAITGTLPISITLGSGTIAVSIANAAADASTKGAVTFVADDMNCTAGVCGIDYTNAQKASGGQPGLLTAADWTAFEAKGNVVGVVSSVDNELALFSGTGGKTLKRATTTGMLKGASGVLSAAVADTDYQQPVTWGIGLSYSAGTARATLTESGTLFDGTADSLVCGEGTGGQMQIGPDSNLEYCGYEATPLLHIAGAPGGLAWGEIDSCEGDENQGKLTVISGTIQCAPDVSNASTAAWNDGGATSLTCGGGAQGEHQVMNTGRVEYCGGEDASVLYAGFLLPTPLSFNITAATCTGDASGGKLTVNGSNQVVCASDVVGEGGGGPGDVTAFGSCATGDCATAGSPLTSYWMSASAAPVAPAATQGRVFFDETAKNLAVIADDSAIKYGAQVIAGTEHFFLTSFAADGTFAAARPSSATLSDGSTLVKLTDAQVLTNKHVVHRQCTLSASSGAVAVNADGCDIFERYDVAGTLDIANPTATAPNPRDQQVITFDLLAAAAQTITWGNAYDDSYGLALPTTIPAGRRIAIAFRYNANSTKYELWSAHDPNAIVSSVQFYGSTSGVVTMQAEAAAGTYTFRLPTSAGTAGQPLLSAAGAGPHTYGTLSVAGGGSGAVTLTGLLIGNGTSAFTAATSSTVGQILRVTGANTYALGAVDLADADAVTNVLPVANLPASSDTASGVVELATTAETSTGTDAARAVTPDGLAGSVFGERYITLECVADDTDLTTGDGKCYFPFPSNVTGWLVVGVHAHVGAAVSSSGVVTVDIDVCGAVATGIRCSGSNRDLLSTNITIDASEDGTETSSAAAVIDTANDDVATGEWMRVNVDAAGTNAKGLYLTIVLRKP